MSGASEASVFTKFLEVLDKTSIKTLFSIGTGFFIGFFKPELVALQTADVWFEKFMLSVVLTTFSLVILKSASRGCTWFVAWLERRKEKEATRVQEEKDKVVREKIATKTLLNTMSSEAFRLSREIAINHSGRGTFGPVDVKDTVLASQLDSFYTHLRSVAFETPTINTREATFHIIVNRNFLLGLQPYLANGQLEKAREYARNFVETNCDENQ
jgi:hypothetical protein